MPKDSTPAPKCVAIVRFSAAGDVILAGPVVTALHRAWPKARLIAVTHDRFAPLWAGHPHLSAVESFAPGQKLRDLVARLRVNGVDAVCDLHGSWRSRALTYLLNPRWRSTWHKRSLYTWAAHTIAHAPYRPPTTMESRYHQAACALVSLPLPVEPLRYWPTDEGYAHGEHLLRTLGWQADTPLLGLLPGAAWATKRWPIAHYIDVARKALSQGLQVIAIGSAQERNLTQAIALGAPGVFDAGGMADLHALPGMLGHCQVVVAGDTGPMHMARGLGVRCVVLFGATPASQFNLEQHHVLDAQLHCSPCSFYGQSACPRGHLACMTSLTSDAVWQHVVRAMPKGHAIGAKTPT
jgi:ADP-heptose:LPS heptosyltransferase